MTLVRARIVSTMGLQGVRRGLDPFPARTGATIGLIRVAKPRLGDLEMELGDCLINSSRLVRAVHRLQHPGAAIALVIITGSCAYQNHRCAISKGEADFLCFIRPSTA